MKIPNQTSPIMRRTLSVQVQAYKGLQPQACFDDCMVNAYGISECRSAFQSRDAGGIASCLLNFGIGVNRWAVGLNIAQCGAKCAFG